MDFCPNLFMTSGSGFPFQTLKVKGYAIVMSPRVPRYSGGKRCYGRRMCRFGYIVKTGSRELGRPQLPCYCLSLPQ